MSFKEESPAQSPKKTDPSLREEVATLGTQMQLIQKQLTTLLSAGKQTSTAGLENRTRSPSPPGACFNCGKVGHFSRACPEPRKRFDSSKSPEKSN